MHYTVRVLDHVEITLKVILQCFLENGDSQKAVFCARGVKSARIARLRDYEFH